MRDESDNPTTQMSGQDDTFHVVLRPQCNYHKPDTTLWLLEYNSSSSIEVGRGPRRYRAGCHNGNGQRKRTLRLRAHARYSECVLPNLGPAESGTIKLQVCVYCGNNASSYGVRLISN